MCVFKTLTLGALFIVNTFTKGDTFCPAVNECLDSRKDTNKIRLLQYNVEWLFIDYYKSADCPGNGCTWHNESIATDHLNQVATIINDIDADIINICEIEGCDELDLLRSSLELSEYYRYYMIQGSDTSTGQNVGLMTKLDPITDLMRTENRYEYPLPFSTCGYTGESGTSGVSKHFISLFDWNGINVAYISLHLLAFPDRVDRCVKREAQAMVLQDVIIEYVDKNYEIVVIGDFNDYDSEVSDLNDDVPISQVLNILKGQYSNNKFELYNVNTLVPKEERYSNWWDKNDNCDSTSDELVLIDHVLVTPFLFSLIQNVSIYHVYHEECGTLNSDHYPIIVDLMF